MDTGEQAFLQFPSCTQCGHNMHVIDDVEIENELGANVIMTLCCFNCGNTLSIVDYPEVKRGPLPLDPVTPQKGSEKSLCIWSKRTERKLAMLAN